MATVNDYTRTTWQTGDVIDATKMNNIEAQLDAVTDNARENGVAPVFSTTKTYAVGEHVLYNGEVYRCKTAVASAGAWVANNWTKASLSEDLEGEVSELKSAIKDITRNESIALNQGYYIVTNQSIGSVVNIDQHYQDATYNNAVVDCQANDVFTISGAAGSSPRLWAFIDSESKMLKNAAGASGGTGLVITAPENAAKLILNLKATQTYPVYAYKGEFISKRVDSIASQVDQNSNDITELESDVIDLQNDVVYKKSISLNLIDGKRLEPTGNIIDTEIAGFKVTNPIALDDTDTIISIKATNIVNNVYVLLIAYYTTNEPSENTFISGVKPQGAEIVSIIPENAKYVVFGSNTSPGAMYRELNAPIAIEGTKKREESSQGEEHATLVVPSLYNLIIGDTFELFYKGIVDSFDSDSFYVATSCTIGSGYKKKYSVTPTTTGTYSLGLTLYDINNAILDQKTVSLVVNSTPSSPLSLKNILCVGDSLTQNGVWVGEMKRRLCASDGTPTGFNLSNIAFIGNCSNEDANYEGYGGFTFEKYNTNYISTNEKRITCTHDKTEAEDQHSIYSDGAGNLWKLETINTNDIRIILDNGTASTIPSSGILTWVSGGINHSSITYTAVSNVSGNPFWDSTLNKVDFASYASSLGASTIDYVYVLLGWNNWGRTMDYIKTQAQTFITNVHTSFPNAKVVLIGLEIPSIDGLGNNYGSHSGALSDYVTMIKFVHDIDAIYEELINENTNVYHINLSGQFDTEHNMPQSTRPVNIRNSETETYQTNGIHPARSGSLQIADAATRHIVSIL